MKVGIRKHTSGKRPTSPRAKVVDQFLGLARLIRRVSGSDEEKAEAEEWNRRLEDRKRELGVAA